MMRHGQMWAVDLGISLMVFTVAMLVTYTLLENTLEDTAYTAVRAQALGASDLLLSEGFPTVWTETTVLRAGIISDGVLSLRKAHALATLDGGELHAALRVTDKIAFLLENATGGIEPIFGNCTLGDLTVTSTNATRTLDAMALVRAPYDVASGVNATAITDDTAYALLDNADVVLIEGNLSIGSSYTPAQISRFIASLTRRGVTVIIIGDTGVAAAGTAVNASNATNITVINTRASSLGLPLGTVIDLPGAAPILLSTIDAPSSTEATEYTVLATTNEGKTALATWIAGDARVWYVASSSGTLENGTLLRDIVRVATESMITVSWPLCDTPSIPEDATQVARYDRTVAYHDQFLTLRVFSWRER